MNKSIFFLTNQATMLLDCFALHVITFVVYHCCSFHNVLAANNLHIEAWGGRNKMNNKLVHACFCFHCLHLYDLLKLNNNNDQNWKNIKLFGFFRFCSFNKFWKYGINPCGG